MKNSFNEEMEYMGSIINLNFHIDGNIDGSYYFRVNSICGNYKFNVEQKRTGDFYDYGVTNTFKPSDKTNKFYREIDPKLREIMKKHIDSSNAINPILH